MTYRDLSGLANDSILDVDAVREHLRRMTDSELLSFGRQMRGLVFPLTYDFSGKPVCCAFSIQLDECRAECRRRHPKADARSV
jgi:hypothetical protein